MTFLIAPSLIEWLPWMTTFCTRLSAPRSCSSMARARPGNNRSASAASARAARRALAGRRDFTLGRVVVALHGGPVLEGSREVVVEHEDEEAPDQHQADAL